MRVATVPTVYGIETAHEVAEKKLRCCSLQQYLPFTVLKLWTIISFIYLAKRVATVPTVYGIETNHICNIRFSLGKLQQYLPFTVLKPI